MTRIKRIIADQIRAYLLNQHHPRAIINISTTADQHLLANAFLLLPPIS